MTPGLQNVVGREPIGDETLTVDPSSFSRFARDLPTFSLSKRYRETWRCGCSEVVQVQPTPYGMGNRGYVRIDLAAVNKGYTDPIRVLRPHHRRCEQHVMAERDRALQLTLGKLISGEILTRARVRRLDLYEVSQLLIADSIRPAFSFVTKPDQVGATPSVFDHPVRIPSPPPRQPKKIETRATTDTAQPLPSKQAQPLLMTIQAASAETGLPYTTLRDLILNGHLAYVQLGDIRRFWIRRADLEEFIAKSTTTMKAQGKPRT